MTDITLTNNYFRAHIQFWIWDQKGKSCDITHKSEELTVHHVNIGFNELLREAFELAEVKYTSTMRTLSTEQISEVIDNLILLHQEKAKVVTLTYQMHRLYHKLNNNNVSEEQYNIFKNYIKKQRKKSNINRQKQKNKNN